MSKRFLVTNALMVIQNHYAEQLFGKFGDVTISGETARIIETNNCDHYTQIGIIGSNERFLFDLDGLFYVVPESWAKEKVQKLLLSTESKDFKFLNAENIDQLIITATSEDFPVLEEV